MQIFGEELMQLLYGPFQLVRPQVDTKRPKNFSPFFSFLFPAFKLATGSTELKEGRKYLEHKNVASIFYGPHYTSILFLCVKKKM